MSNTFPEGSYFDLLFKQNPDLIIEIRSNGISVYSLTHAKTGFSNFSAEDDVEKYLKEIAENIKDLT